MQITPNEETTVQHKMSWYVHAGGEVVPRQATMRGTWGYEAKCSCGWETHTGGGTPGAIKRMIADHRFDVAHGFWTPEDVELDADPNADLLGFTFPDGTKVTGTWDLTPGYVTVAGPEGPSVRVASTVRRTKQLS